MRISSHKHHTILPILSLLEVSFRQIVRINRTENAKHGTINFLIWKYFISSLCFSSHFPQSKCHYLLLFSLSIPAKGNIFGTRSNLWKSVALICDLSASISLTEISLPSTLLLNFHNSLSSDIWHLNMILSTSPMYFSSGAKSRKRNFKWNWSVLVSAEASFSDFDANDLIMWVVGLSIHKKMQIEQRIPREKSYL